MSSWFLCAASRVAAAAVTLFVVMVVQWLESKITALEVVEMYLLHGNGLSVDAKDFQVFKECYTAVMIGVCESKVEKRAR